MQDQSLAKNIPTEDAASVRRRLRRVAKASGFNFKRSTTTPGDANRGGFQLYEMATNTLVAGDRYQLDLKDVAKHLQRLGVLGYGGGR